MKTINFDNQQAHLNIYLIQNICLITVTYISMEVHRCGQRQYLCCEGPGLIGIFPSDGDVKFGSHLGAFR